MWKLNQFSWSSLCLNFNENHFDGSADIAVCWISAIWEVCARKSLLSSISSAILCSTTIVLVSSLCFLHSFSGSFWELLIRILLKRAISLCEMFDRCSHRNLCLHFTMPFLDFGNITSNDWPEARTERAINCSHLHRMRLCTRFYSYFILLGLCKIHHFQRITKTMSLPAFLPAESWHREWNCAYSLTEL